MARKLANLADAFTNTVTTLVTNISSAVTGASSTTHTHPGITNIPATCCTTGVASENPRASTLRASFGAVNHQVCHETWSVQWSPDETLLAWSCGNGYVTLMPWNRHQHRLLETVDTEWDERLLDCLRDPVMLDCGSSVWSVSFGAPQSTHTPPHSLTPTWAGYELAEVLYVATGLRNGQLKLWDARNGRLLVTATLAHVPPVSLGQSPDCRSVSFSQDGRLRLAAATRDGKLTVWDARLMIQDKPARSLGLLQSVLMEGCERVYNVCWSPQGQHLAAVGQSNVIMIYTPELEVCYRLDIGHDEVGTSCAWSPDGAMLAVCSFHSTTTVIWDPFRQQPLINIESDGESEEPAPSTAYMRGVAFCKNGRHLATISDDNTIRFYDMYNPRKVIRSIHLTDPLCCVYAPTGHVLAVGTRSGILWLWSSPTSLCSLQHYCRLALRHAQPSYNLQSDTTAVPQKMQNYLLYKTNTIL